MSERGDMLVAVVVLVLITGALAAAAEIRYLPSWSTLFPARPRTLILPIAETAPKTKPRPWCDPGTIVGGFCVPKPTEEGTFTPLEGQHS
jgi:hypothetical protein